PDPNDRHVLAAAIAAGASLVTFNVADFPRAAVPPGLSVLAPDDFVLSLIQADLDAVATVVDQQAAALRNPPMTTAELLEGLAVVGLAKSVDTLRSPAL
ncbi:MAG TPA: PIN domain-containing protein, partial [Acidimicrobiales bacterium]|nr:PIN domain-containing protein [Acidimicrobiales bacterium]